MPVGAAAGGGGFRASSRVDNSRVPWRYGKDHDSLFTFMTERGVPPTNNGSERDIRTLTVFRTDYSNSLLKYAIVLFRPISIETVGPQPRIASASEISGCR